MQQPTTTTTTTTTNNNNNNNNNNNSKPSRLTLDGALEEGLAGLAGRHAVVVSGGHVPAHQTEPLDAVRAVLVGGDERAQRAAGAEVYHLAVLHADRGDVAALGAVALVGRVRPVVILGRVVGEEVPDNGSSSVGWAQRLSPRGLLGSHLMGVSRSMLDHSVPRW